MARRATGTRRGRHRRNGWPSRPPTRCRIGVVFRVLASACLVRRDSVPVGRREGPMSGPISKLYAEEGQLWLRVNHGHSVSEHWLRDNAPDLYAEWWAAPSAAAQDQVALRIEQ